MKVEIVNRDGSREKLKGVLRVETDVKDGHGERIRVILLDADDTFDIVIEYPEGSRETLREITQQGEQLGE
jgi:hypothetical protein